jgi:hypothetical protein
MKYTYPWGVVSMKKRIIICCSVILVLAVAFSFIPLFDGSVKAARV